MVRNVVHAVLAVLLWIVFAYYWYLVSRRTLNPETKTAVFILGLLALFTILFLTVWIYHNIRIHRKLQRRKARREGGEPPRQDYLGRWFVTDRPEVLRAARYIEVDVKVTTVDGRTLQEKVFRTTTPLT